jgi:hypothetical protein
LAFDRILFMWVCSVSFSFLRRKQMATKTKKKAAKKKVAKKAAKKK